jgi:hypothetical protein
MVEDAAFDVTAGIGFRDDANQSLIRAKVGHHPTGVLPLVRSKPSIRPEDSERLGAVGGREVALS